MVAIYSSFLQRAFDQIITDVSLHDLPVVFLIDRAGITGPDGPSHHGVFDLSYLRMIPNMVVGAPADAHELAGMIETAVAHDGPIAIQIPEGHRPLRYRRCRPPRSRSGSGRRSGKGRTS